MRVDRLYSPHPRRVIGLRLSFPFHKQKIKCSLPAAAALARTLEQELADLDIVTFTKDVDDFLHERGLSRFPQPERRAGDGGQQPTTTHRRKHK